jgi:hypothetical protein
MLRRLIDRIATANGWQENPIAKNFRGSDVLLGLAKIKKVVDPASSGAAAAAAASGDVYAYDVAPTTEAIDSELLWIRGVGSVDRRQVALFAVLCYGGAPFSLPNAPSELQPAKKTKKQVPSIELYNLAMPYIVTPAALANHVAFQSFDLKRHRAGHIEDEVADLQVQPGGIVRCHLPFDDKTVATAKDFLKLNDEGKLITGHVRWHIGNIAYQIYAVKLSLGSYYIIGRHLTLQRISSNDTTIKVEVISLDKEFQTIKGTAVEELFMRPSNKHK